jgi:hypothetical protein
LLPRNIERAAITQRAIPSKPGGSRIEKNAVNRQDANPLAGALRACLSEISTNLNESNICDESDILNHTEVDAPAMLVLSPDTKVQCRALARHAGPYKATWSGRTLGIGPHACKFPIAEARWLFYRRLCC